MAKVADSSDHASLTLDLSLEGGVVRASAMLEMCRAISGTGNCGWS